MINAVRPPGENFIYDGITRLFKSDELFTSLGNKPFETGASRLAELAGKHTPFFLQIHTVEVHDPYSPQEPFDEYFGTSTEYSTVTMQQLLAQNSQPKGPDPATTDVFRLRYDQGIAQADAHIAAFLNAIPSSVLNNTVIIFAADHGEAFGEHNKVWHSNSVHQEEIHIPLMIAIPGVSARRVDQPVSLLDMAPTVLSLMNIPVPHEFLGKSMIPLQTVGVTPKMALYNLANDPGEAHSIASSTAEIPQNLLDAMAALKNKIK
jgi:arylsulfatase A-like enzyme